MLDDLLAEVCFWLELAVESPTSVSACGPILPAADRFEAVQGETETQRTFKTGKGPPALTNILARLENLSHILAWASVGD
eukprot:s549_g26.t1